MQDIFLLHNCNLAVDMGKI